MITWEGLQKANAGISGVNVKGKKYALVAERVQKFREMCPAGRISTAILDMANGYVTIQATICDETGSVLATGIAQEKEGSTNINKTSYVENCETSAVGRALGMLGIGSEISMASAEEVVNAINQQEFEDNLCNEADLAVIEAMWKKHCLGEIKEFPAFKTWPKVTKKTYADFMAQMKGKLENGTSNEGKNQGNSAGVPQPQDSGHARA